MGEDVRLVSGFHNVAAHKLAQDVDVDCDILIFGDEKAARAEVVALADAIGLRIFINKLYQVDGAGIRITGEFGPAD